MIMDGNGRWAKKRLLPRVAGHARGVKRVRDIVEVCIARNIRYLTLFAFSTENWKRPADEVDHLMGLFVSALEGEVNKLSKNGIRLRVIGDLQAFSPRLQALIASSEARTAGNDRLVLTIAANYGGQWDIRQAFSGWLKDRLATGGSLPEQVCPEDIDLKPISRWPMPRIRIWSSAPAASSASATSCGRAPIPGCSSPIHCGLISALRKWRRRSSGMRSASGASARPASSFRLSRSEIWNVARIPPAHFSTPDQVRQTS
jgi:hypothetical protein